jgi:HEAT repeat protein
MLMHRRGKKLNFVLKVKIFILVLKFSSLCIVYPQTNEVVGVVGLIQDLSDTDMYVRKRAVESLVRIGTPAVEPLISALKDENWQIRDGAAVVLGKIKNVRAVEPLIVTLKDKVSEVQKSVVSALGEIKDTRAVEPLIDILKNDATFYWVREKAAEVLGKIKDARAVEPLITALNDKDWQVRNSAVEALGKIKDTRAVKPLIGALNDENSLVRMSTAQVLDKINDARAVKPLIEAMKEKDLDVIAGAYKFFILRGEPVSAPLLIEVLYTYDNVYDNTEMARVFLNCGNKKLKEAAEDWAKTHGYTILSGPFGNGFPIYWGNSR